MRFMACILMLAAMAQLDSCQPPKAVRGRIAPRSWPRATSTTSMSSR